jgi:pilus assembly protein Flp/PilA
MYLKTLIYMKDLGRRFRDDEDGLALTEYLILLGLLTAAVIGAVTTFGDNLSTTWTSWAGWASGAELQAP